ncbi:MAG: BTAD domain-containing putative transcriptional regulator [Acidimicrobiales bacterium]
MAPTELRVLGGLTLSGDGGPRRLGGPKAQQLLSALVAHRRNPVSTDRLIETLWGAQPPKSAKATVQSLVSRLRVVLAGGIEITCESAGYRLDTILGDIDADQFEALLERSRAVPTQPSVPLLESALALWHGPAFGRYADLDEVRSEAVRLDELRLVATDAWAEARVTTGDPAPMVGELAALVSLHPLRESYWRLLALALYRTGRQAEALRRIDEFRQMLGQELGLDLSPTVRELEAQILAHDLDLLTPPGPPSRRRTVGLGVRQLLGGTSFIGRDPDLRSLSTALRDQPLVTVTGPGGVGKTRLALRVAGNVADYFGDGVIVVEFAPLRDPAGTVQVIANALDIQQRPHQTIESTIEEHLVARRSLLVLDNCEHVTDAVAPVVDRLRSACPQLRILVTSREPLGLAGEHVEVLAPLTLPTSDAGSAYEVSASSAVELFVARAAAATPGFTLSDDNAAAVAGICRRLDGLPLGLELAAARLRSMGIDTLAARLHHRTDLLGQTQRCADGRQRTLNELVAWSHELLQPEEQDVFEQLAVFAGGFDLSAAEAVCSIGATQMPTLDHLASLVDKSMVVLVDSSSGRYRMLEPLREFGMDRLRERGTLAITEDRHLNCFLDVAERCASGLDSAEEATWSAELARDLDNFRAAHLTALRRGDADRALRLVASLREFAFRRVQYEVTSWASASMTLRGASDHPDLSTVIAMAGYGKFVHGDIDAAISLGHRALDAHGDAESSDSGLPERVLGNALFYLEQADEAQVWMDRMLQSARRSGSHARIAHALYMRSVAQTSIGDGIRGAVLAGEASAAAAAAGSPTAHAQASYALGVALERTDPNEALAHLERASAVAAEAGNRWIEAFALTEVHWLRAKQGQHLRALAGYAEVVELWYLGGDWANQWLSLRRVLGILIDLGAFEVAAVLHGALIAVGAAHALPFEPAAAERLSKNVEHLRSLLGPAAFADAVRQGASMKDGEIISYVREHIALLTGSTTEPELPPGSPSSSLVEALALGN